MTFLLNIVLKALGMSQFGPVINAALAVKANPNPITEGALIDAAKALGESEDAALTPVFEAAGTVAHDGISLIASRTTALEIQTSKDVVTLVNTLIPSNKQVPAQDLTNLENDIAKILADEGIQ